MTDQMFKPGYDGERPSGRLSPPERQAFLQAKPALVERIHTAMLVLSIDGAKADLGIKSGSVPAHIVEFGDRIGQDRAELPRARFKATPAQVSDVHRALALLEGLRPEFFKVVFLRAIHDFQESEHEDGEWPWARIGAYFGRSETWAQDAYAAVIVQASRRAGALPAVVRDHAILLTAVYVGDGWLTSLLLSGDPRQEASNLRGKSPVRIESVTAIWMAGKPVAKRVLDLTKARIRNLADHASWFRAPADVVAQAIIAEARAIEEPWHMEDLDVRDLQAA